MNTKEYAGKNKRRKESAIRSRIKKIQSQPDKVNISTKKGLKYYSINTALTRAQQEVLILITEKYLTIEQIAKQRKCSPQAVYKLVKQLRNKGAYDTGLKTTFFGQPTSQPKYAKRLHGQEFNIKILTASKYYYEILKETNILYIDNHTIRLYRESIEIYAGDGVSFAGETEQVATSRSLRYWSRFFIKLEQKLKITLIKSGSFNIKLVNQHYGNFDTDFVNHFLEKGERIRIYANDNGKLWFLIDQSFGFIERENLHPETAKQDSEKVSKQLNDWRDFDPSTNSELDIKDKELEKRIKELEDKIKKLTDKKSNA